MIQVEIENFQSIVKASIQIDGFTALVGRSNIGKSAIVRALKCALTGAVGTDFVRHGKDCERRLRGNKKCKCQSTVSIKFGTVLIVWEKGDAVNKYTVTKDGQTKVYDSVDRGTPEFLLPDFTPVKIGDSKEVIQVSEQFDPIFLLNQSGPAVADVLSDVARLDRINIAMSLVNKDRKDAAATRKVREKDIVDLKSALEDYDGLDAVVARTQKVTGQHGEVNKKRTRADMLERFVVQATALSNTTKALLAATKPEIPDVGPPVAKAKLCESLHRFYDESVALGVSIEALSLATEPEIPDLDVPIAKVKRCVQIQGFYNEVAIRAPIVRALAGVDNVVVPEVQPVKEGYDHLSQTDKWFVRLEAFRTLGGMIKSFDEMSEPDLAPLQATLSRYEAAQGFLDRAASIQDDLTKIEAELDLAEKDERKVLDEFDAIGVCPTCSQKVEAGHLIVHEAVAS
jgi:hypothetical protein